LVARTPSGPRLARGSGRGEVSQLLIDRNPAQLLRNTAKKHFSASNKRKARLSNSLNNCAERKTRLSLINLWHNAEAQQRLLPKLVRVNPLKAPADAMRGLVGAKAALE
jgi:hypothetical protein